MSPSATMEISKSRCAHSHEHTLEHSWELAVLHHLPSSHLADDASVVDYAKLNVSTHWPRWSISSFQPVFYSWLMEIKVFVISLFLLTVLQMSICAFFSFSRVDISCDRLLKTASFKIFSWMSSAPHQETTGSMFHPYFTLLRNKSLHWRHRVRLLIMHARSISSSGGGNLAAETFTFPAAVPSSPIIKATFKENHKPVSHSVRILSTD